MGADLERPAEGEGERVHLYAGDQASLLVGWLDELVFRAGQSGRVYTEATMERLADNELVAVIRGRPLSRPRTRVKAALYQGLQIASVPPTGFSASVALEV